MKLNKNNKVYFDDLTHTYLMGDQVLTGVTTMMKQMGVSVDYGDIPQDVLDYAAARGHAVHRAIECYCTGEEYEPDPAFAEVAWKDLEAYKGIAIDPMANEYLVSDCESIASSIDIVAKSAGGVDLIDIKTTTLVHKEAVAWQLSIYKWLFSLQNPDIKVNRLWCLHLRDGAAKMIEVSEIPQEEVLRLVDCFRKGEEYTRTLSVSEDQQKAVRAIAELERAIIALDAEMKKKKTEQEALKGAILDFMRQHNKSKWEISDELSFTRIEPTTRATVDSARLKKEMPEVYQSFLKESIVKESLRINLKK